MNYVYACSIEPKGLNSTCIETMLRIAAIKLVKRWVPDVKPMDQLSQHFAVRLLRRLESKTPLLANGAPKADAEMQNGEEVKSPTPPTLPSPIDSEPPLHTAYLPPVIEIPARPAQILQHVQLIFALCVKVPELLEEYVSNILVNITALIIIFRFV